MSIEQSSAHLHSNFNRSLHDRSLGSLPARPTAGAVDFEQLHTLHWGIKCFHRAGKQLCALQRFRVRLKEAIHTHIFCALRAFVELELQVWHQQLGNWYE